MIAAPLVVATSPAHNRAPAPRIEATPKKRDARVHLDLTETATTFLDSQRIHHTLSATLATFSYQPIANVTIFASPGYKHVHDLWAMGARSDISFDGLIYNVGIAYQIDGRTKFTASFGRDMGASPISSSTFPNFQNYVSASVTTRVF